MLRLLGLMMSIAILSVAQGNSDLKLAPKRKISITSEGIPQFVFSANVVAVTDQKNNAIAVYDIHTGRLIERVSSAPGSDIQNVFRADRLPLLASVNTRFPRPDEIDVFDVGSKLKKRFSIKTNEAVSNVAFSSDGHWLATANPEYASGKFDEISIFSTNTGQIVRSFIAGLPRSPRTSPQTLAFSPDDKLLVVADERGGVTIFEVARLMDGNVTPIKERFVAHSRTVGYLGFSPDGKILATGDGRSESVVRLWDTQSWQMKQTIRMTSDQIDEITGLRFHPVRPLLAISSMFKAAIYDTGSGKEVWKVDKTRNDSTAFNAVDFSPDGRFFGVVNYASDPDRHTHTVEILELNP